jgi:hypothetical protein
MGLCRNNCAGGRCALSKKRAAARCDVCGQEKRIVACSRRYGPIVRAFTRFVAFRAGRLLPDA